VKPILVNNAGVALRLSLEELTEEDFDWAIAINVKAAFLCTHAVFTGMRERGWGRIINISSGAAPSSLFLSPMTGDKPIPVACISHSK